MHKKVFIIIIFIFAANISYAQLGGLPGAFARMGFNARGISMGNAMSSVTTGDVMGYYNPALSVFQNEHLINLSYSFLSFDRTLNFVSYTKNFKLPNQSQGGAGITFSWINAGVKNIDARDGDGFKMDAISVYENQFSFAPSIRFSEKVALGVAFKMYYSKLYDGVKSTSLGFDVGAIIKPSEKLSIAVTMKDLNSKYQWNTTSIYSSNGATTTNKFPVLFGIGASYLLPKNLGVISAEFENSSTTTTQDSIDFKSGSNIIRMGAEINPVKYIKVRAGFDRFDLKSDDKFGNTKVSFGLGFQKELKSYILGIDYSFVMEPYSNKPFQTLTAVFKIK